MFCSNCGIRLNSDGKFCRACGTKVNEAESSTPSSPTRLEVPSSEIVPITAEAVRLRKKYRKYKWLAFGLPILALFLIITLWGIVGFLWELNVIPAVVRDILELFLPILITITVLAIPVGIFAALGFDRRQYEATLTNYDERSGKGDYSIVPEEIKGWNWGAFALGIVWGLRHNVWFSLLAFIPVANLFYLITSGIKGSEWAWRRNKWESVEAFKKSRRKWNIAGLIVLPVFIALVALGAILDTAEEELRQNDALDPNSGASTATAGTPEAVAREVVNEFKKEAVFPQQLDEVTTLDDVQAIGSSIVFYNRLTEDLASKVRDDDASMLELKDGIEEQQREVLCTDEELRGILEAGVKFEYWYSDPTNKYLFELSILAFECSLRKLN